MVVLIKKSKKVIGDFVYEDLGDRVRCRDIFSNNVINVVPKKKMKVFGDFALEDCGDSVKCRDLFSNHVIEVIFKKKGGRK